MRSVMTRRAEIRQVTTYFMYLNLFLHLAHPSGLLPIMEASKQLPSQKQSRHSTNPVFFVMKQSLIAITIGFGLICISSLLPKSHAITAFDCKDIDSAHKSYSLLDVPSCVEDDKELKTEMRRVQLLQPRETNYMPFIACNVEYRQQHYGCGVRSYMYLWPTHQDSGVQHIDREQCKEMHRRRVYHTVNDKKINNLKMNATIQQNLLVAGSVDQNGNCENGELVYQKHTLKGVVFREYEITLTEGVAVMDLQSGMTKLSSTHGCRQFENHCSIADLGDVYVDPYIPNNCDERQYKAIYEGPASITYHKDGSYKSALVETQDLAFDLLIKDSERVCGRHIHQTEHPSLLLDLHEDGMFMRRMESVRGNEIQVLTHINSKFLYFSKKTAQNFLSLRKALAQKRCQLESETVKNRAALATLDPDLFAFTMNGNQPGTSGKVSGEIVHLFKCRPKSVTRRNNTKLCFEEMPVKFEGKDFFVTPNNRILTPVGSPTPCIDPFPPCFNLGKTWFSLTPNVQLCPAPSPIELDINKTTWKYQDMVALARAGIYTTEDISAYEKGLVMPSETRGRSKAMLARYYGNSDYAAGGSGMNLMNSFDIDSLGNRIWGTVKGVLNAVGTTTSSIIGILSIIAFSVQIITCSAKRCAVLKFHGCSVNGLIQLIPGGSVIVWAREKLNGKSAFEKLQELSPAELIQFDESIKRAYEELGLERGATQIENRIYPTAPTNFSTEGI